MRPRHVCKWQFVVKLPKNARLEALQLMALFVPDCEFREYQFPAHIELWADSLTGEARKRLGKIFSAEFPMR